jgi:2-polyprenyl-3-methyl-5-hydroxy-6-metoxy-1,4-benzoquinol methylase
MACPLCNEKKYLTLRQDKIKTLSEQWQQQFGFDAFSGASLGETIDKLACVECGLIYFSPAFYGDSIFYSKLSQNDWYYEADKWEFDRALELVKLVRPKSILEIGCGAGEFLQKVSSGVEYSLGLDINESALELARQKGLEVCAKSVHDLERSFDMIVLFEVLEHLESPGEILRAIESKLNPGGVLVIAVPNPYGYLKDMGVVLLDMPPHHNTSWKKETFDYLAKMLEMEVMSYETEPLRYVHYQGFLSSMIAQGTKNRYLRKAQQVVARIVAPFLFVSVGNQSVGQTHLVALKKGTR